jgi:cyclic-di-GMP-binding protein
MRRSDSDQRAPARPPAARLTRAGGSVNLGRPRSLPIESGSDCNLHKRGTLAESSFDVVSSVDLQEVKNAIAQAMKEVVTRFDLKGTDSDITLTGEEITLVSSDEFKIKALRDILESRLFKRNVPLKALEYGEIEKALGQTARQKVTLQKGISSDKAREIVKVIKNAKIKVQAAIQGDQVRVTGKNRDDLQAAIRLLKETDLGIDMQFTNYR